MTSSKITELLLMVTLCLCSSSPVVRCNDDTKILVYQPNCLRVPFDRFVASVNSTIHRVGKMTSSFASESYNISRDCLRVSNALSDCLELLDTSADQLGWTLEALLNPLRTKVGTGDLSSDLRTWLSSVIVNLDSCKELLDHGRSNNNSKISLGKELKKIASLVLHTLAMVHPNRNANDETQQRPFWLELRRRKLVQACKESANAVVALDGSGQFTSINKAVKSAPKHSPEPFVIYVKRGVYNEYVVVKKNKWNIVMIGDGMDATIITGSRSVADGLKTYHSATFSVKGRGFIGKDMTFENTAGPEKHQAVAFLSDSDQSVLYRCSFRGYQDTLYTHNNRQFYKECVITGTIDFIFGHGTVVFQDCQVIARKGLPDKNNTITAQGRKSLGRFSAFSLQSCNITVTPEAVAASVETYLGRPWKRYSTTVVMQSEISAGISPQGWLPWSGEYALDTLYYGEYMNVGSGADVSKRVGWPGFHVITDAAVAEGYTVANLIAGNAWLPSTGIPYKAGL
ncbi:OLC1v1035064C2 [Oldenlandia corymbosa var. corymbosa]|uniref:Pectinesterase n=1 Tax=Oldenlandia corymbosa var. corymbosa TaxID=529605 RepID=A0AAV1CSU8_OLDCO|nr:OLC1v1035064C2 [Oldenlandia corymbosa var. corymbosa]